MGNDIINFSIPTDNDGCITFQCPFCNTYFKLDAGEVQEDDVIELFCPSCGLSSEPNKFLNEDIIERALIMAKNHMADMLNSSMKKMERQFKGSKGVTFKAGKKIKHEHEKTLYEVENELQSYEFKCCDKSGKIREIDKEVGPYCPYCGVSE